MHHTEVVDKENSATVSFAMDDLLATDSDLTEIKLQMTLEGCNKRNTSGDIIMKFGYDAKFDILKETVTKQSAMGFDPSFEQEYEIEVTIVNNGQTRSDRDHIITIAIPSGHRIEIKETTEINSAKLECVEDPFQRNVTDCNPKVGPLANGKSDRYYCTAKKGKLEFIQGSFSNH